MRRNKIGIMATEWLAGCICAYLFNKWLVAYGNNYINSKRDLVVLFIVGMIAAMIVGITTISTIFKDTTHILRRIITTIILGTLLSFAAVAILDTFLQSINNIVAPYILAALASLMYTIVYNIKSILASAKP